MARLAGTVAALGLAVACAAVAPAALGAERGLTYIVPVAAGSADVPEQRPAMPELLLNDGSSLPVSLRRYRGRVVLINFWSPFVPASIKEMVFLDRLQGDLKGEPFTVLAINEDKGGIASAREFLTRQKMPFLKPFADPGGSMAQALAVRGLPTSVVVDKYGRMALAVEGPYEWDNPKIVARLRLLINER